jgi:beta-lactamase regulating signal transducer with metallopeptidase domain
MIDWLIETSIAVTFLMLLVLAVRKPVAHFFGAGWAYALWALPALRLVLPPMHLLGDAFPSLFSGEAAAPMEYSAAPIAAEAANAFSWEPLLLAAWLGGAAAVVVWQSWRYLAFIRRLGIGSRIHASLAQEIGIIESPEVEGPLAIGLLDRWIVVPADFGTRYTPREQRLALQHERTHHSREDIFWNMVALGVLALNWFNPVAYLAFRAFRTDQELSCDAVVAARASSDERHDYALALVKSASRPGLIAACPLNHAGQLKRRLRMIKAHRRSRLRALGGSGAVAALLLTGISVTESASIAAPDAAAAAPAPPAPPVIAAKFRSAAAPVAPLDPKRTPAPRAKPARTVAKVKAVAPAAENAPHPDRYRSRSPGSPGPARSRGPATAAAHFHGAAGRPRRLGFAGHSPRSRAGDTARPDPDWHAGRTASRNQSSNRKTSGGEG